jgi:protein-disulfide isomerase
MLRQPMSKLPLLTLVLFALACDGSHAAPVAKGPQRSGRKFDVAPVVAATPNAPTPTAPTPTAPTPTPTPLPAGAHPCDAARLQLAPDAVVATLDGKDITASELGKDVDQAEAQAQRTYCDTIAKIREGALEGLVDERLIEKAAAAENQEGTPWFRAQVEKLVEEPNDAEIAAFYEQNKSEETPPLELVRDQVVAELLRGRQQSAAQRVLARLRKEAEIATKLPDVRLPPPDLGDADTTAGFGPKDAAVHIVEFSDFECPYCARAAPPIEELKKKYGDRVRFSFRHFPLSFHPNARPAAEAAQCAEAQDKFWAFHDAVFARSSELGGGGVRTAAEEAGLDLAKLDACLASGEAAKQVDADMALASEAGVSGTPSFFLDGRQFEGGPSDLAEAIEAALQKQG